MASVDVRQFALVAISRGWYVKQPASTKHSFTRAELALAAGVYEGLITPTLPDDTTVALRTIIDHLPEACNLMFSKAEVTCPFCHARSNSVVTTFSSCISWKDLTWTNLKQALAQAQPFVGHLPRNWHAEGCNRDDQDPKITKLGKWLYLELRPYPVLKNAFFPLLSESSALILDDSLVAEGLYVDAWYAPISVQVKVDTTGWSKSRKGKCSRFMTHYKEFNPSLKKSIACYRSQVSY